MKHRKLRSVVAGLLMTAVALGTAPVAQAQTNQVTPAPSNVYQPGRQPQSQQEKDLLASVNAAKTAGVTVTQQATVNKTVSKYDAESNLKSINDNYVTQKAAIDKAVKDYTTAKTAYDTAMKDYNTKKAAYDKAVADRNTAIADKAKIEAENAQIVANNAKLKQQYDAAMTKYQSDLKAYNDAVAQKAKVDAENKTIQANNDNLKAAYDSVKRQYDLDYADYLKKKNFYDQAMKGQTPDSTNPNIALTPEYLLVDQPIEFTANPENFVLDSDGRAGRNARVASDKRYHSRGNNLCSGTLRQADPFPWNNTWETYNSNFVSACTVTNGDSLRGTWLDAAKDKASGRSLDLVLNIDDIQVDTTKAKHPGNTRPFGGTQQIYLFSNSKDLIALENVSYAKLTFTYRYADTLQPYDKSYYLTTGSLDWSEIKQGDTSAGLLTEFSSPGNNVLASFVSDNSYIKNTLQPVYGPASSRVSSAFYVDKSKKVVPYPTDIRKHGDDIPEVFSKIGVTYLVKNGASINVGESYTGTQFFEIREYEPSIDLGGFFYNWIYNHLMLNYVTVAPTKGAPIAPKAPPVPNYTPLKPVPTVPTKPTLPVLVQNPTKPVPTIPPAPTAPTPPTAPKAPSVTYQLTALSVMPRGVLKVNKEIVNPKTSYAPGEVVQFKLEITNDGTDILKNVILQDIPDSSFVSGSLKYTNAGGKTVSGNQINIGDLASKEVLTFTAQATLANTVPAGGNAINLVRATSPDDPTKGPTTNVQDNATLAADTDGSDTVKVPVVLNLNSSIKVVKYINNKDANTKTDAALLSDKDETMQVKYVITNTGEVALNKIALTDNIAAINTALTGISTNKGANGAIALAPNESVTITLPSVKSPAIATYHTNTGTVTGTTNDARITTPKTVTATDPAWAFRYPMGGINLPPTGVKSLASYGLGILALLIISLVIYSRMRREK